MKALLDIQRKLYPEIIDVMQHRYKVLQTIQLYAPLGRRMVAEKLDETERIVRKEIEFLQEKQFIQVTSKGMYLTDEGKRLFEQLQPIMDELMGIKNLEKQLQNMLNINRVIVTSGNSDDNDSVKQTMGKACMEFLKDQLQNKEIIAVTGGTTMAAVAKAMYPFPQAETCLYVPARGAIGEKVELQANTIAAEMARKAGGKYRLLYVPDPLSETTYQTMLHEPSIAEILEVIRSANIVLHGIGDALTMAMRRRTPSSVITKIKEKQAVSEAFGYYFNREGEIVHQVKTLGIQLEDLPKTRCVITIAGGHSKAKAITSYLKQGRSDLLITDEGAALAMLRDIKN